MNYLLMGLGLAIFGVGAVRQFGGKKDQAAANQVVKAAETVIKEEKLPVKVMDNPASA